MATRIVSDPAAKTPEAGRARPTPAAVTANPNSRRDTVSPAFAVMSTSLVSGPEPALDAAQDVPGPAPVSGAVSALSRVRAGPQTRRPRRPATLQTRRSLRTGLDSRSRPS